MSLNLLNRHPAEVEAEAMLSHPQPYPEGFTFNDRTSARMERARLGLVHVMVNLLPAVEDERKEDIYYWLDWKSTRLNSRHITRTRMPSTA